MRFRRETCRGLRERPNARPPCTRRLRHRGSLSNLSFEDATCTVQIDNKPCTLAKLTVRKPAAGAEDFMPTDIRLDDADGNWIMLQSLVLRSSASDFMLDSPSRRRSEEGLRRALVHNTTDGLTINFAGDYPGGVVVEGDLTVTGQIRTAGLDGPEDLKMLTEAVRQLKRDVGVLTSRLNDQTDRLAALTDLMGASVVPPWQSLEEVEHGDDMGMLYGSAEQLGFIVEFVVLQAEPGLEHNQLVKIDPPPGTLLRKGSIVRITINRLG